MAARKELKEPLPPTSPFRDTRERVRQLSVRGLRPVEMADELGVSRQRVGEILREEGLPSDFRRGPRRTT